MRYDPRKLSELLAVQGRTVNWLAEQTGYHPSTVSRFLSGSQPISDEFATRAARSLGIPSPWLHIATEQPESVPA